MTNSAQVIITHPKEQNKSIDDTTDNGDQIEHVPCILEEILKEQ